MRDPLARAARAVAETLAHAGIEHDVRQGGRGPRLATLDIALSTTQVDRVLRMGRAIAAACDVRRVRLTETRAGVAVEVPLPASMHRTLMAGECIPARNRRALEVGIGYDARGRLVRFRFAAATPHMGIWGRSQCGKSEAVRNITWQLATGHEPAALALAMLDGKRRGLVPFAGLPHLAAPLATTPEEGAALIANLLHELDARRDDPSRCALPLVVVVDEVAEFTGAAADGLCRIARLGAELGVRLLCSSQHPTTGDVARLITANLGARLVGHCGDDAAARLCMGGKSDAPRMLEGNGDMLLVVGAEEDAVRVQSGMVTAAEWAMLPAGERTCVLDSRVAANDETPRTPHAGHMPRQTTADEVRQVARLWQDGRPPGILKVKRAMGCGDGYAKRLIAEAEAVVYLAHNPPSRHIGETPSRATHAGATTGREE